MKIFKTKFERKETAVLFTGSVIFAGFVSILSLFFQGFHDFVLQSGLLNPFDGWVDMLIVTGMFCTVVFFASFLTVSKKGYKVFFTKKFIKEFFLFYPIWGMTQQYIFFTIYAIVKLLFPILFWPEIFLISLFVVFHFPNWFLMFSTGLMISVFLMHMNIYHNIFAVGIAHGMMASMLEYFSPKYISTKYAIWSRYIRDQQRISNLKDRKNGQADKN